MAHGRHRTYGALAMRYALLSLALLLAACGTEEAPDSTGTLRIEAQPEPNPPRTGQNALVLHVHDADGQPVAGASLSVEAFMPSMSHGSTQASQITDNGDGSYRAEPLTFQMPGLWQVDVHATAAGEEGSAVFTWDVD